MRCRWLVSVIIWCCCCIAVNGDEVQKQFCSLKGDDCTFEAPSSPVILAREGKVEFKQFLFHREINCNVFAKRFSSAVQPELLVHQ